MAYLQVNSLQQTTIQRVTTFSEERSDEVLQALINEVRPTIKSSALRAKVEEISEDEEFASAFCSLFLSLSSSRRAQKLTSSELIEGLLEGIRRTDLDTSVLEWFQNRQEICEKALESEALRLPSKALHLSTDFEHLFMSGSVVTDIRPVFDSERVEVSGAIVSQTLKLRYISDGKPEVENRLSLALDAEDMEYLIKELQKAQKKAESVKAQFETKLGLEIFVVGEESYGVS